MVEYFRSIYEGIKIALQSIWSNKLRAALTTFGIVIGILSVTTMATVIDGLNRGFESSLDMLGKDVVYVQKWPWSFGPHYKWWEYINRPEMKLDYVKKIQDLSRYATAVSASDGTRENVYRKDKTVNNVNIDGTTVSYTKTSNININSGRFFTNEENRSGRMVCIVGSAIAENLFQFGHPLGKEIKFGGQKYKIIGVLAKQGKFLGLMSMDDRIIIPINTYKKFYGIRHGLQIQVKYPNKPALAAGQYELEGIMRRIRKQDPAEKDNFAVNKLDMFRQQYDSMTKAIYLVGFFLTALALFVGGIGVMNIMFVSVKERTREIGIRKAVGAKYYQILIQFLIEAIVVCSIGGAIGILFSMAASAVINQYFVAYLDWKTVIWAFLICAMTGIAFGFLPAYKAAKSDPISSLRYE
ncbi:MAG TPA: ABC transporter permease [Balneolales bacterium]|nr:ABC transporter permease [Balneolales bacterium]